ncbi:MAG: ATP-binding protein [Sphingomonadaceae bacterium]
MPLSDACIQAQLLLEADTDPAPYFVIDVTAQRSVYHNPAAARHLFGKAAPTLSCDAVLACLVQGLAPQSRAVLAALLDSTAGQRLRGCTLASASAPPGLGWDCSAILTGTGVQAQMHVRLNRSDAQPRGSGLGADAAWRETALALVTLGGNALTQTLLGVDANAGFCRLLPLAAGRKIRMADWMAAGMAYFDLVCLMAAIDSGQPQERTLWLRPSHGLPQHLRVLVSPASEGAGGARSALLLLQPLDQRTAAPQQAGDGSLQFDANGRITHSNAACGVMLGRSQQELLGQPAQRCLHPQARRRCIGLLRPLLRGEVAASDHEMPVLHPQRGLRWIALRLWSDPAAPGRVSASLRDVTERFNAERLQQICGTALDNSASGVVVCDYTQPGCPIVYVNRGFSHTTGYGQQELLGQSCSILQGPLRDQPGLLPLRRALARADSVAVTLLNFRKDGTRFWNALELTPIREPLTGIVTHYLGLQHDVTAQHDLDELNQRRDLEIDYVFRSCPFGVVSVNPAGEVRIVSHAFEQITGLLAQRFVGLPVALLEQALRLQCAPAMDGSSPALPAPGAQLSLKLALPKVRLVEVRAALPGPLTGKRVFFFQDVTNAIELARAKTRFLAAAAHELRTPLGSIRGFTELLLMRHYERPQAQELLEIVRCQAEHMGNLLTDLLDLSKLESRAAQALEREHTDLGELLEKALQMARPPGARHAVRCTLPARALQLSVARNELQRVLINLISNAYKYTPESGSIELTLLEQRPAQPGWVGISVADSGIGIAAADQARLFQRFFRADPNGSIPGTGLGLAISQELVKQMAGQIEVDSQPGQGSVFTVWLRRQEDASAPHP